MKNNELLDFIDKNKNKKLIAIQGLGFVGSAMSLVCANAINGDYAVIGVDQPTNEGLSIVNSLNDGVFPFIAEDPKIDELFKTTIKKNIPLLFLPANIFAELLSDFIIYIKL